MSTAKQAPIRAPTETVPEHVSMHGAAACGAAGVGARMAKMKTVSPRVVLPDDTAILNR